MTRILVVEDDAPLRDALTTSLRAHGYDASEAGTAEEAVSLASHDVPDLVLLCIEPSELTSELMWESSADAFAGEFPHVYGPITIEAVRAVVPWRRGEDGFEIPDAVYRLEEL